MIREKLVYAQKVSIELFEVIEGYKLIVPGKTESQVAAEISELAAREFGISEHWHKKIVRSGKNTLANYPDYPPDRMIEDGDIVFVDLGPIVAGYEADIGRTYVLGNDPIKQKLKNDVEKAWYEIHAWYHRQTSVRADELFRHAVEKAVEHGWEFTGDIAGHIVGRHPHEQPPDPASLELDVHPDNPNPMQLRDAGGHDRHWILELQFIDRQREIGAYFEQLL